MKARKSGYYWVVLHRGRTAVIAEWLAEAGEWFVGGGNAKVVRVFRGRIKMPKAVKKASKKLPQGNYPDLSEIVMTTLRHRSGALAESVNRNNAILAKLAERGAVA